MQIKNKQKFSDLILWLTFTVLAIVLIKNVNAEALRDPTQIPSDVPMVETQHYAAASANTVPALQSVMLSADIQAAIISGKKVNLGEKFEESKLINLTENSATLRANNGAKTVLKMHQVIVKKNSERRVSTK
jgi:hypothetical protein